MDDVTHEFDHLEEPDDHGMAWDSHAGSWWVHHHHHIHPLPRSLAAPPDGHDHRHDHHDIFDHMGHHPVDPAEQARPAGQADHDPALD